MLDETIREDTSSEELWTGYGLHLLYLQLFPPHKLYRDSMLQYQPCTYMAARAEKVFACMLDFCYKSGLLEFECYKFLALLQTKKKLGNFVLFKHTYDPQLHRISFLPQKSPIKEFKGSIQ